MAGRGAAPKPKEQRRNRHAPQRGEWVDLRPLEAPILPELPEWPPDSARRWHPRTLAVWSAWRDDPATSQYGPAEVAAAVELAYLHDAYVRGEEKSAEVRLRMDGLGLTSKGKRDLRWRTAAEVETIAAQPRLAEVRRLHAVDPSAA